MAKSSLWLQPWGPFSLIPTDLLGLLQGLLTSTESELTVKIENDSSYCPLEHAAGQHPLVSSYVVVKSLSCIRLFLTPWTAAHQASLFFSSSWSLFRFMSVEWVLPSNHLILCCPLLLLPSIFPSIMVFSNEPVLHIKWPKYWNFSISPSSEYSGLISLQGWSPCSPRDSQESSRAPQFESVNSLVLNLLYGPTLASIHDYWKKPQLWLYRPLLAKWCICFLICCLGLL